MTGSAQVRQECTCGNPECRNIPDGGFYVIATRGKTKLHVVGPVQTHAEAMELLPRAWLLFWKWNPKNTFKWTTVKMLDGPYPVGRLNDMLGIGESQAEASA